MESNPIYGDPFAAGHIQLHDTYDEIKYHTLQFEHKPASEQEEQHAINDDSNHYHTLQRLDHKPKYGSGSEYCTIASTSNQCNAAGVQKLGEEVVIVMRLQRMNMTTLMMATTMLSSLVPLFSRLTFVIHEKEFSCLTVICYNKTKTTT